MSNSTVIKSLSQHTLDTLEIIKEAVESTDSVLVPRGMSVTAKALPKSEYGRFQAIGRLSNLKEKEPMDIFDALEPLSKAAYKTFNTLKYHRDLDTNLIVINKPYTSKGEGVVFNRQVAELRKATVLKRVPVSEKSRNKDQLVFMLNPGYIRCMDYLKAIERWNRI